jgi:surfeit locus 1 family protein
MTLLTLVLLCLLIALGRWQLHRAAEKQALFDAFAAGTDATREVNARTPRLPRYQHLLARGHYDPARQILIDNMVSEDGRAGYFVLTPFALAGGGWILVNRGWVPLGASRAQPPATPASGEERALRGRANDLPRPGMRLGNRVPLAPPYPVVADYPTRTELGTLLHEPLAPAAEMVLLDAGEADGYLRRWAAPGFPPMRHIAYAVQWFGLGLALLVIYVVTNLRRRERVLPP